jgi:ClpP class serine protease
MLTLTEASQAGSVGVIARFDNTDRAEKNAGNDPVVIRSKELKAPGNGPMSPNQMGSLQKLVMKLDGMFEEAVKRARAGVKKEAMTGESFIGQECVDLGLCDKVATMEEVLKIYGSKILT